MPNLSQLDIHVVSGTLKYFLRSLKEPLITTLLWKDFTSAAEKTEAQDAAASLYQAISELPQPNRDTLAWLICHLQRWGHCDKIFPSHFSLFYCVYFCLFLLLPLYTVLLLSFI